jgi:hypothetical protein
MGLSASSRSHECDGRSEEATQYQISPTELLSNNSPMIGLLLINRPHGLSV